MTHCYRQVTAIVYYKDISAPSDILGSMGFSIIETSEISGEQFFRRRLSSSQNPKTNGGQSSFFVSMTETVEVRLQPVPQTIDVRRR